MFQKIGKLTKKILFTEQKERGAILIGAAVAVVIAGVLWYFKAAIGKEILYASGTLLLGIARVFFKISANIFETVGGSALLSRPITKDPMVVHGWAIVRNFANMFVVLGFVVVGLATILRLREYEAQKLLLPLILVALLINFSLLFTGIIIDATNITMNYFTQISGPGGITQAYSTIVTDPAIDNKLTEYKDAGDWENYASYAAAISVYVAIAAMIFFIYAILFIFRYVALMSLVMLAPLGFVCYVFPATKPIFKKWWEQFTQWAIIGIPAAFFVYLAGHLLVQSGNTNTDNVLAFWIPTGFLLFAYSLIFQTSAIGASAAMGLATGAVGFAWGATKGTVKFGGKQAWDSRAGQWARDKAGKGLERLNLRSKGATDMARKQRLEEPTKRLEKAYDDNPEGNATLAKMATQRAVTAKQRDEKAASADILARRKAFGTIDPRQRDAVAAYAVARGVDKNVFTKARPETGVEVGNKEAIEKVRNDRAADMMKRTPGMTADTAWAGARTYNPIADEINKAKLDLRQRKVTENALGISQVTGTDVKNKLIEDRQKTLIDNARKAGRTMLPEEALRLSRDYKPSEAEMATTRESLSQERIQMGFSKLDVPGIRNLPKEALSNLDFIKNVGTQRLARAGLEMSQDKIDKIKESIPEIQNNIRSELGLAYSANAAQVNAAFKAVKNKDTQKKVRDMVNKINIINGL